MKYNLGSEEAMRGRRERETRVTRGDGVDMGRDKTRPEGKGLVGGVVGQTCPVRHDLLQVKPFHHWRMGVGSAHQIKEIFRETVNRLSSVTVP
jgi:hypothetical protein